MFLYSMIAVVFLILTFISTRKLKIFVKIPIILVVLIAAYFLFKEFGLLSRGGEDEFKSWYEVGPWKHFILFLGMILGMSTNYLYEFFRARMEAKEAIEKGETETKMPKFIWEKFVLPFVISFLIFGYFWGQYGSAEMGLPVIFASYQNGFFWQTILGKIKIK